VRLIERLRTQVAWVPLSGRWWAGASLAVLSVVVLIPTWIVLPPDDEGLFLEIQSTAFQAKHLFTDSLWNPGIALGAPQPFNETLTYHPFALIYDFASPAFSIGFLYQIQLWIALFAVWAMCRHLGMRRWISVLCAFTFALSATTINYMTDFWPAIMVGWTLSPLLLLLVLKLLDSERRWSRAVLSVSAGLCASLMLLDGHAGVFPVFAIGLAAFLTGRLRRLPEIWPWLGVALLVFALASATKAYDLALETMLSDGAPRKQQVYDMDWDSLFLYPLTHYDRHHRLIAFGGPFMVLTLVGLAYRRIAQRHADGLRLGVVISFLGWFVPVAWLPALSGNWYFRDPFTLFAILLAGITLQRLWDARPGWRPLLLAAAGLQIAVLVWGFYPFYRDNLSRAIDYLHGRNAVSLKDSFKNQPLYAYFEQRPDHRSTRAYMTSEAGRRLMRVPAIGYEFAGWDLHGLRLVNGSFRGIDMRELVPMDERLHSEIPGDKSLPKAQAALNVLNVGYVLATPNDSVAPALVPLRRFTLQDGRVIVVYRNPFAWPDAVVLSSKVKAIDHLPSRPGCAKPGLLCADFTPLEPLRRPGAHVHEEWHGTSLLVRLAPSAQPSVLLLSQMYRPGWEARLSDGRTVGGYPVLSGLPGRGLTAFDLPPGARSAEIKFRPTKRLLLAGIGWATLFVGFGFVIAAALVAGRRRTGAGRGRVP